MPPRKWSLITVSMRISLPRKRTPSAVQQPGWDVVDAIVLGDRLHRCRAQHHLECAAAIGGRSDGPHHRRGNLQVFRMWEASSPSWLLVSPVDGSAMRRVI